MPPLPLRGFTATNLDIMNEKKKESAENSEVCIEIGRRLAELRKAKGLTQVQFAEVSGVSSTYIARIEKGHHSPSIEMLQRLLAPLGAKIRIVEE